MKLNDFYKTSLEEAVKAMDIVSMKVHSDDDGIVNALEIKYVPMPADEPLSPAWN
ncbi:MAG: hypothetical protein ACRDBO_04525 [Lachnospiraceae bacterium]